MAWLVGVWLWLRKALPAGVVLAGLVFSPPAQQTGLTLYVTQPGTPAHIPNFVNPSAGCSWTGIGGQVFTEGGQPATGLIVRIGGTLEGRTINQSAVTGSAVQFGPGGYEVTLSDHPVASTSVYMQLYDVAGRSLSGRVLVRLVNNCQQNLTVINLKQTTFSDLMYLPLLSR